MERSKEPLAQELTELRYTGTKQPPLGAVDSDGRRLFPYIPTPELIDAANLAIFLQRPLLLRGEPGCGKSLFASAIAYELNLPLEIWSIRSTTRAADGLYIYDAIARLRDAQFEAVMRSLNPGGQPSRSSIGDFEARHYVRLGPVGRSFQAERRGVLLIDEIDKADIDFPNDILDLLENRSFPIEETGELVTAKHPPVIIVTSNDEKELPEAFLRRCLFANVAFPDPARLEAILRAHFGEPPAALLERALRRFQELRSRQEQDTYGGVKKVSTSELIDWMRVLLRSPAGAADALASGKSYPHPSVLIKRREDLEFAEGPMGAEAGEADYGPAPRDAL